MGLANDGREPPRGNANGVFVKVNSEDRSVKGGTVKVWTRHGVMEVPRPGVRETKVEVVDGDRIRLKIRSPGFADPPAGDRSPGDKRPISGRYRVAVYVGDEWVGTAAVTTATSREEERAANAAFEGSIRRAQRLVRGGRGGDGRGGSSWSRFIFRSSLSGDITRRHPPDDDDDRPRRQTRGAGEPSSRRGSPREPDQRPARARGRDGAVPARGHAGGGGERVEHATVARVHARRRRLTLRGASSRRARVRDQGGRRVAEESGY